MAAGAPLKFLSFDLEFSKLLPKTWGLEKDAEERQKACDGVDIIAAACCAFDGSRVRSWTFRSLAPLPLSQHKVDELVEFLLDKRRQGYLIVSWGGMASDFRVLCSRASPRLREPLREAALAHVDMALVVLAERGMMVGLESVCKACLQDKREGKQVPSSELAERWRSGGKESLTVLRHVEDDAFVTGRVYGFVLSTRGTSVTSHAFRLPVKFEAEIPETSCWISWETRRSDRTMVVPLRTTGSRLATVEECREEAGRNTFPWDMKAPFTVEACCAWV